MFREMAKLVLPTKIRKKIHSIYNHQRRDDWLQLRWLISARRLTTQHRLARFKDKHKGERCFIIGNGPSLKGMDLQHLRGETTFGLNRIYLLFPEMGFQTNYLVSVNQLVLEQCADEIEKLNMPKFLSWRGMSQGMKDDNTIFLKSDFGVGFSKEPARIIYESATVTNVALQLAFFMGFSKVILIGVDHSFSTKGQPNKVIVTEDFDPNHFDPNYFPKGFKWHLPDLDTSELGYVLARKVNESDGREVVDATVEGKLEIFRKVNYSDLFD